jgi:chaperonin cofactor prefoldin
MGVWNFIVDMHQSGQISELEKRIEDLEKKVVVLKEWVDFLEAERNNNDRNSSTSRQVKQSNPIG